MADNTRTRLGQIMKSRLLRKHLGEQVVIDLSCKNVVFIYTILRYIYILSTCLQAAVFLNLTNRVLQRKQGKSIVFFLSKPAFTKKAVDSRHSPRRGKKLQSFLKRYKSLFTSFKTWRSSKISEWQSLRCRWCYSIEVCVVHSIST